MVRYNFSLVFHKCVIAHYRSFTARDSHAMAATAFTQYTSKHNTFNTQHIQHTCQRITHSIPHSYTTQSYMYVLRFALDFIHFKHTLLKRKKRMRGNTRNTCFQSLPFLPSVLLLLLVMCACSIKQTIIRFLWGDFISKCLNFFSCFILRYVNFHRSAFPENSLVFPLISMRIHHLISF